MTHPDPQAAPPETDLRAMSDEDLTTAQIIADEVLGDILGQTGNERFERAAAWRISVRAARRLDKRRLARPDAIRERIADEIRGMDAKALYDVFWKAKPNGATTFEEWRCKQIAAMAETIAQSVEGRTAAVAAVWEAENA
jgi:hypothetical protein